VGQGLVRAQSRPFSICVLVICAGTATNKTHDETKIVKYYMGLLLYPVHICAIAERILKTSLQLRLNSGDRACVQIVKDRQNILHQPM
jgi:hypothetical protein